MNTNDLNNPVWQALTETHKLYAIEYEGMKFYDPDICPFGGFSNLEKTQNALEAYSNLCDDFFVVGNEPLHTPTIISDRTVICDQMILTKLIQPTYTYKIKKLTKNHIEELYKLVWLVMPGYFKKRTFEMGDYFGIFIDNKLVAVSGERLQMDKYIELSAVVTHPNHIRKGMAKQLVAYTSEQILKKNKTPILHVAEENTGAIKLYNDLGFKSIRKMVWRHYLKV
ncbi:FR47-like protein [Tenacibaculum sp. MAR_2009_124]|uniref:GNAT family N-acetyltransferase n=1 Tax=Tenacibaculum sp. MAR_2009_124 TaxID=1250059 RepID=UPI0008948482|nr:GNAT family N-acetyltransferase [Tenacibaculum sp. MAR_2009_124]SEB68853.1 FR47-like protein [Tenacibaculum sp. MAR_2009_124]